MILLSLILFKGIKEDRIDKNKINILVINKALKLNDRVNNDKLFFCKIIFNIIFAIKENKEVITKAIKKKVKAFAKNNLKLFILFLDSTFINANNLIFSS